MKKMIKVTIFSAVMVSAVSCIKTDNVVELKPLDIKITLDLNVKNVDNAIEKSFKEAKSTQDLIADIKTSQTAEERMLAFTTLRKYKQDGVIKEDGKGYIAIANLRAPTAGEAAKFIKEENAIRKASYQKIAKEKDTTVEFIAEKKALEILEWEEIRKLKKQEIIAEDELGFVVIIKKDTPEIDKVNELIKIVNENRLKGYEKIAIEQNTTAEMVGRQRALRRLEREKRTTKENK